MGGLYVSNYEWMATVVLVFFVFIYVPIFLQSRISTIPESLERRFGPASRKYMSGLTIVTNLFVDTAGSLYAGAVVLMAFFPQLDIFYTCVGLAIVAGLYTAAGGLAAVGYTDVIQAVGLLAEPGAPDGRRPADTLVCAELGTSGTRIASAVIRFV